MMKKSVGLALGAFLSIAAEANATVIFSDNFDGEGAALNYTSFANWSVLDGSVDVVSNNTYSIFCAGGAGKCVDLDGSTGNAGDLRTTVTFAAGNYTLTFDFSGNQRVAQTDIMTVSFGDLTESFSVLGNDADAALTTVIRNITVGAGGSALTFSHAGGDNIGLILDNVSIATVEATAAPEPASLALFGAGVFGLAGLRRRRQAA